MKDFMEKDPREAALPKWAQGLLLDLRRTVTVESQRATEARKALGARDSNTVIDPYDPIPLPADQTVRLVIGDTDRLEYVDVRIQDNGVQVISGATGLRVLPRAANHVVLEIGR